MVNGKLLHITIRNKSMIMTSNSDYDFVMLMSCKSENNILITITEQNFQELEHTVELNLSPSDKIDQ